MATMAAYGLARSPFGSWRMLDWLATVNAIAARDYPLVTAGVLAISVLVVIGALLADLAVAIVDPRIRLS
jgi:ABC-type microcin C transport system permease subunit YejB